MQKGQYYRGALQVEDEEAWGIRFFKLILKNPERVRKHFFLIREAVKDIPHGSDHNRKQKIRALSKIISEKYKPFFDLRVKMHSQPESTDLEAAKENNVAFLLRCTQQNHNLQEIYSGPRFEYLKYE